MSFTQTTKFELWKPDPLSLDWSDEVNENFDLIDAALPDCVSSSRLLNDDATIIITPVTGELTVTTSQGFGQVMMGQNQEFTQFRFDETNGVTIFNNTTNVDVTDNDGYLCIFMAGTDDKELHIKNRLGSQLLCIYEVRY